MSVDLIFIISVFIIGLITLIIISKIGKNATKKIINEDSIVLKNKIGKTYKIGYTPEFKFRFDDYDIIINDDNLFICPHYNLTLFYNYIFTNKKFNESKYLRIRYLKLSNDNELIVQYFPMMNDKFLFIYKEIRIEIKLNIEDSELLKYFIN